MTTRDEYECLKDAFIAAIEAPPEDRDAVLQGHEAWLRFNELASQMGADNRQRLLHELDGHKGMAKAQRAKSCAKA